MTHITFHDGVAIVMLAFYALCLPFAATVSLRHGFAKASGWIFLAIFSIVRIVGCSSQMATLTQGPDGAAATIAEITNSLGISPLLLASLGLTSRLCYSILEAPWNSLFSLYLVRLIQIPALVALILCIVGATSTDDPATIYSETTLQVGVILFAVVLVALMLLSAAAAIGYRKTGRGERQLVIALCVSLPLLMIRVIYSIVSCFGSHAPGSILASATKGEFLQIFLANIEEMAVTVIYICAGLKMPSVPTAAGDNGRGQGPGKRVEERFKRGDFGGGRLGLISLVVELVSGVFRERNARGQQAGNGRDQQAQNHALAKERYDRY